MCIEFGYSCRGQVSTMEILMVFWLFKIINGLIKVYVKAKKEHTLHFFKTNSSFLIGNCFNTFKLKNVFVLTHSMPVTPSHNLSWNYPHSPSLISSLPNIIDLASNTSIDICPEMGSRPRCAIRWNMVTNMGYHQIVFPKCPCFRKKSSLKIVLHFNVNGLILTEK